MGNLTVVKPARMVMLTELAAVTLVVAVIAKARLLRLLKYLKSRCGLANIGFLAGRVVRLAINTQAMMEGLAGKRRRFMRRRDRFLHSSPIA
jgi:hypothetical protein